MKQNPEIQRVIQTVKPDALAVALGVHRSTVFRWRKGQRLQPRCTQAIRDAIERGTLSQMRQN